MNAKSPKWLDDIATACSFIAETTAGASLAEYSADLRMRYAVERNVLIIGEALLRLERTDPETVSKIPAYRSVIGLRNRLAHVYEDTDNGIVWDAIENFLPKLRGIVETSLLDAEREFLDDELDDS